MSISFRGQNTVYDGVEALCRVPEISASGRYTYFFDITGYLRRYDRKTGMVDPLRPGQQPNFREWMAMRRELQECD
jgi:hypothetical protein